MNIAELADRTVNRSVLTVLPKQPFCDWVNSTDPSDKTNYTLESFAEDPTAYLVHSIEEPSDLKKVLRTHHKAIFENELAGWYTDETLWPKQRGLTTFHRWFGIRGQSVVTDLSSDGLGYETWPQRHQAADRPRVPPWILASVTSSSPWSPVGCAESSRQSSTT